MNDPVGAKTLDIMSKAKNYNRWLFNQIRPWLTSPVAEVGAGTGTFTKMMSDSGLIVTAIDQNLQYLINIKKDDPNISTLEIDMGKTIPSGLRSRFSSVIALNVIEHITNDGQAIANIYSMLKPSGRFVMLVPAHMWAYGTLDKNLGHVRRYDSPSLIQLLKSAGFKILQKNYTNTLGLLGWLINGIIFRRSIIPESQLKIFDFIFSPFLFLEKYLPSPIGLSLLVVAQKI